MMRRAVVLLAVVSLSACSVPHARDSDGAQKRAIAASDVDKVIERYSEVRQAAADLLDDNTLSIIETGAALDIDAGSFEVSQRLAQSANKGTSKSTLVDVFTPNFRTYPLWFVAVVNDSATRVRKVQVYLRETAVTPWLVSETPEVLPETSLPSIRENAGIAIAVDPSSAIGMALSAQEAAAAYAIALQDGESDEAGQVANDSFIQQMRASAAANAALDKVTFSQTWTSEPVEHVLRTSDGGALAFVTFDRIDTYKVSEGLTITWPDGSPQKAFLADGISDSGRLAFKHQVLMYVPPGDGKPLALGQFGGVVAAELD